MPDTQKTTDERIAEGLRAMSDVGEHEAGIFEDALEESESASRVRVKRAWSGRVVGGVVVAAAACLVLFVGVLPNVGQTRSASRMSADIGAPAESERNFGTVPQDGSVARGTELFVIESEDAQAELNKTIAALEERIDPSAVFDEALASRAAGRSDDTVGVLADAAVRTVVKKARLDITAVDARSAYLTARSLVREAGGEFVESANLRERDSGPEADLTLRVRAERLDEVMTALRGLGEVTNERVDSEDVSDQLLDLGARIANERRVEAELSELVGEREDADLDEILRVRTELSRVRGSIERMEAQRARIGQLAALSTVTVLIRQAEAEEEADESGAVVGLWDGFVMDLRESVRRGVEGTLGAVVWVVGVVVGGLLWWVVLGVVGVCAVRAWRRRWPAPLAV